MTGRDATRSMWPQMILDSVNIHRESMELGNRPAHEEQTDTTRQRNISSYERKSARSAPGISDPYNTGKPKTSLATEEQPKLCNPKPVAGAKGCSRWVWKRIYKCRLTFEISGTGRGTEAWRSQTKARVKFPLHRLVRRRVVPQLPKE